MKTMRKWYCLLFLFLFVFSIAAISSPQQFFNKEVRDLEHKYNDTLENEIHTSALKDTMILEWNRTWGKLTLNDHGRSTVIDSDYIYIAGITQSYAVGQLDLCLIKYNFDGVLIWNITWDPVFKVTSVDMALDNESNIYVACAIYNPTPYGDRNITLVKFDKNGQYLWDINWDPVGEGRVNRVSMALDSQSNIFVITVVDYGWNSTTFMSLLKFNNFGELLWEKKCYKSDIRDLGASYYGFCVDIDIYDNVYITGSVGDRSSYPNSDSDIFLDKYNGLGDLLWSRTYGGDNYDEGLDIEFDSLNNIYITGLTYSYSLGYDDVILIRCNSSGDLEWQTTWGGTQRDHPEAIKIDSNNNLYLTGSTVSSSSQNLFVLKFNTSGNLLWNDTRININREGGEDLAIDKFNSIYVLATQKFPDTYYNIFLLKLRSPSPIGALNVMIPQNNDYFGLISPDYKLYLEGNFYKISYTLNGSLPYYINNLEGSINQSHWDILGNGTVLLEFSVQDYFGNNISTNVTIHKDLYYPQIKINQPTSNQLIGKSPPEYNITIWSLTLDSFWYNLNDGSNYNINTTSGVINQSAWNDCGHGNVSMKFYANNTIGQTNFKEIIVRKDSTPPIFSIVSPAPNQLFGVSTLDFQLTINEDNLDSCQYSLNGGLNYTFTGSNGTISQEAWDTCINGTVNIQFYLNDTVGNSEAKGIVVRKDIIAPNNTILSPNSGQFFINSVPTFNVSISDPNLNSTWYTLNNGINHYFSGSTGIFNQTSWNSCADGLILAKFYAEDSVGNINVSYVFIKKNVYTVAREGYALIVGIENYPGSTYDLWYCRDDALLVYDLLINNFNYKPENVYLLLDGGATRSAMSIARGAIENKITPEDTFFFYFSGHGGEDELRPWEEFICPYDSLPSTPSKFIYDYMWDLWLDNMNCAEKYIILDSCRSGGFITSKSNRFYMTACGSAEDAYEDSSLGSGVFTYYFLRAMAAVSDSNGDGVISLEEWFSYIDSNTKAISPQDPQFYDGISGSAVLHPSIGEVSVTFLGNQVDYLFTLFGQGLIETLKLQVCSISNSIYHEEIILLPDVTTFSGFETYTGSITFVEIQDITGYRLYAEISGNETRIIEISDGLDSDGDTLLDIVEILDWGTDPRLDDTDGDLLSDDYEIFIVGTNPLLNDTDGDGYEDGWEVYNGYDPLDPDDYPIEATKSQSIPMGGYFLIFLWLTIICISIFQYKKRIKINFSKK